jgi:hypothetical protein
MLVVLAMGWAVGAARAGVSFGDPTGGWTYIYTGDQCLTPFAACLDGTWNHYDAASGGSDAWDGSAPGQMGAAGAAPGPGGAGIFQEGDTSFLRIQDCGDPRSAPGGGWADPGNRKVTFTHNITTEVSNPTTLLDDGVTLSFRARIPTTPPLDPLYPANGGPSTWATAGYNIHDDGYGVFGIKQGTSGLGCICFSLAMDTDEGDISANGLTMNKLNGTAVSANVDSYDSGGTENTLAGFDPTDWHEFWIQIVKDTSGGGTHKVTIWMDGDVANPRTFHVTAGTKSEDAGGGWSGYLVMSLGRTAIAGSQDVDFFAYKAGLQVPQPARDLALAWDPSPADQKADVLVDAVLGWKPGDTAAGHNVYLGTNPADVNNATEADPRNVLVSRGQTGITYQPAKGLAYGQTYYWRVDEVDAPPSSAVFQGDLWSFTVEPYGYPITNVTATASSFQAGMGPENTVNGSGLNAVDEHSTEPKDMWLSTGVQPNWIQYEFDRVYKLYELKVWNSNQIIEPFIGFGAKSVTIEYSVDGTEWRQVPDVPEFGRADGLPTYTANTTVNLGGVEAQYVKLTITSAWGVAAQTGLSEVRFSYIPVQARAPEPAVQSTDVGVDTALNWRPGHEAASHTVYFGTDPDAVANGTVAGQTVTEHSFSPGALNYDTTYYWRVDEVNTVTYPGEVWSFTTLAYDVVDDFEGYTDQPGQEVFSTWVDGFDNPAQNGAIVGLATAVRGTFCDTIVFHGGKASMPFTYDNTAAPLSEATRTFVGSRDWTAHGVKSLSLWFRGTAGNGGQLYVKINNTKVPYGQAADLAKTSWLPWNIDLSAVVGVGKVTKVTIGVEGAGAKGTLYIDDIRLYPKSPEYVTPAEPGTANLQALWTFEGNANDTSGHGLNGTLRQAQLVSSGRPGGGSAVRMEKVGYVDLGNPKALDFSTGDWAVTAWFKTAMTGSGEANVGAIYGKGGDGTGGKRYCLILSNTTEGVVSLITDDDVTKYVADSQSATNDDQWHFVVGQRQGTILQIYIDGLLEGTTAIAAAYDLSGTSQHNAYIGAITNNVDGSLYKLFNGMIDDVRVYNRALSPGEVLSLMGQTTPVAKPF